MTPEEKAEIERMTNQALTQIAAVAEVQRSRRAELDAEMKRQNERTR